MLFKIVSASLLGIEAYPVEVEVDVSFGVPTFITVGLPDTTVKESKERVKAALKNCGYHSRSRRIIINLAPADRKKEGSAFDLPICLGLLAHLELFPQQRLEDYLFLGEVALDGKLKPVKGVLASTVLARKKGFKGIVIPQENEKEAALVQDIKIYALESIVQVVNFLRYPEEIAPSSLSLKDVLPPEEYKGDFQEIKGQHHVKRALEVAAAGAHNVLMIGPPGAGKTMLARRLPSILPDMTFEEILEVTQIYSASGLLKNRGAVGVRPFRFPHHTVSHAGLIGGGIIPKPGEVSLAHNGVLFLDELPEFRREVLEDLRQPVEDGMVTISRASMALTFPCSFMLVAAMNPCEDVFSGFSRGECTEKQRSRYYSKISGPLLDRIDIQVEVPRVEFRDIVSKELPENSAEIRKRVSQAKERQLKRFKGKKVYCNAQMGSKEVKKYCTIDKKCQELLEMAVKKLGFSARAYTQALKVARTISDLEGKEEIDAAHVSEAIQYRIMDKYF